MKPRILIIEDDTAFGIMLQNWCKKNNFDAVLCSSIETAKKNLIDNKFNIVLSDLRLPDSDGIMLLAWLNELRISVPVIIMTSYAEVQSAVSAIKLGAYDYLEKPINPPILKQKIEQALNNTNQVQNSSFTEKSFAKGIEGNSIAANQMYEHVKLVAPTMMSVLITGESGTGKEYVARVIHENSNRKESPFIAVDCGNLSKELAPSELFGHLKGSFTSAIANKKGIFEQAKGGTVFLDEIGNLPYEVQVQLLRALQEHKIRPVGSATDIDIDIRIITATNENLETAINNGKFREDLYHRINEFSILVPPLRERREDIPLFANYFLVEANAELGKQIKTFSKEAMSVLKNHYWGGNLRELRNVVRRTALFTQTDEIVVNSLPQLVAPQNTKKESETLSLQPENERELIESALKKCNGNKTKAAQLLKIDRKTLYNKMHFYNIEL